MHAWPALSSITRRSRSLPAAVQPPAITLSNNLCLISWTVVARSDATVDSSHSSSVLPGLVRWVQPANG